MDGPGGGVAWKAVEIPSRIILPRRKWNSTRVPFTLSLHPRIYLSPLIIRRDEVSSDHLVVGNKFGRSMKNNKRRPSASGLGRVTRERDVQYEIKSFLSALVSYPDRFAVEPELSFEQHLFQLVAANQLASREERRRA